MNYLPIIIQPNAKHTASIIFLHGFGDTGHGWASIFKQFKRPHIKYIFPTAKIRPITLYHGEELNAWFDKLEANVVTGAHLKTLDESSKYVQSLIQEEISNGIQSDRIILGGFSQGGACSLYTLLKTPLKLAGVLALSTYMPQMYNFRQTHEVNNNNFDIPLLQCHGTSDTIVKEKIGRETNEFFKELGFNNVRYNLYMNLEHTSNAEELSDISEFIDSILN